MKQYYTILGGLLFAFLLPTRQLRGQNHGFHLGIGGGFQPVLQAPKAPPLLQPLLGFPRSNGNFVIEAYVAWKSGFAIGGMMRYVNVPTNIDAKFLKVLAETYPDDFVKTTYYGYYEQALDPFQQGFLFVAYGFSKKKWIIQPRLLAGTTNYAVLGAKAVLKRKDSNQQNILTLYKTAPGVSNFQEKFTLGVGALAEYRITKRWRIFGSIDWSTFTNGLRYEKTIQNQVNEASTMEILVVDNPVHMLNISAGIMVHWIKKKKLE
jgi:hypothetical protein